MKIAYADESVRAMGEPSMYLLGATVFQGDCTVEIDDLLRQKSPGAPKMHWREMGRGAQARSLCTVAKADATTTVIIASPINTRKQERARRKCMETLFPLLEGLDVGKLVMESRNPIQDARDIEMVDIMKSKGLLKSLMVDHVRGEREPRLWFPDLVLGAYGDVLCEDELPKSWVQAWEDVEKRTDLHVISV